MAGTLITTLLVLILSFAVVISASVTSRRVSLCISGVMWTLYYRCADWTIAVLSEVFISGHRAWFWARLLPMIGATYALRWLHRSLARCMPAAAARAQQEREQEQLREVDSDSECDGDLRDGTGDGIDPAHNTQEGPSSTSTDQQTAAGQNNQTNPPADVPSSSTSTAPHSTAASGTPETGPQPPPTARNTDGAQGMQQEEPAAAGRDTVDDDASDGSAAEADSPQTPSTTELLPSLRLQRLMLAMASPSYQAPDAARANRSSCLQVLYLGVMTTAVRVVLLPPLWVRWLVAGSNADVWRKQRTLALLNALFRLAAVFDVYNVCASLVLGAWRADRQGLILSFATLRHRARRDALRQKAYAPHLNTDSPETALSLTPALLQRVGGAIKIPAEPQQPRRRLLASICGARESSDALRQGRVRELRRVQQELQLASERMTLLSEAGLSLVRRSQRASDLTSMDVDVCFHMALFTSPQGAGNRVDPFATRPDSTWWELSLEQAARRSGLHPEQVETERTACRVGLCTSLCGLAVAAVMFVLMSLGGAALGSAPRMMQASVLGHTEYRALRQSGLAAQQLFPDTRRLAGSVPLSGNVAALWLLGTTQASDPQRCARYHDMVLRSHGDEAALQWAWEWALPLGVSPLPQGWLARHTGQRAVQFSALLAIKAVLMPVRLVLNAALHSADTWMGLLPYLANVPSLPVLLNCHQEGTASHMQLLTTPTWKHVWKFLPMYELGEMVQLTAWVWGVPTIPPPAAVPPQAIADVSHAVYMAHGM